MTAARAIPAKTARQGKPPPRGERLPSSEVYASGSDSVLQPQFGDRDRGGEVGSGARRSRNQFMAFAELGNTINKYSESRHCESSG